MSYISMKNVSKKYGAVTALLPIDLEIQAGETLTLLGPSGSGKTTLLNVVAGIVPPSSGRIYFGDREVTNLIPQERGVGMVFQNYALMPHLSVYENVAFPLRIRRVPRPEIRKRVAHALGLVEVEAFAERKPRELSGGQQQRVALARCLVYSPTVILMDEPLGALDKKLRTQLQSEIKRLHDELGFTAIYVTHDQDEAMALSDRICLMQNGGIDQLSTPAELYFNPQSHFAADFLGHANFVDAIVVAPGVVSILDGQAQIQVKAITDNYALGARVRLLIRSESLRVINPDDVAINAINGVVKEVLFLGGQTRITISIGEDRHLVAKELTGRTVHRLRRGDRVRVAWDDVCATIVEER